MPPNLTGYYRFVSQENMDNYLRALDINVVLRKLVCLLKPDKEIIHTGDHMVIRTITSLRDYVMDFDLGVQFEEDLGPVDGRKCQTTVSWEGDQLVCEQLGEKRNRGWRHWLEGDQLHLVRRGPVQLAASQSQRVGGDTVWVLLALSQPCSSLPPSLSLHSRLCGGSHRFTQTSASRV
uniref:Retinol binding protein 5 n=1 Tax=Cyanistes caeruleus TaxID=156563 RepID=A0A8C0U6D1_CYACU